MDRGDRRPATLGVADYWQGLIDKDLVKAEPLLTPEWNNKLNQGRIAHLAERALGAGRAVRHRGEQAGDWAIAPLPQWKEGDDRVAFQGGSALTVRRPPSTPRPRPRSPSG